MKVFILASCLLAIAAASHYPVHQPIHIPVIGPHGVPLEPAEVVHARHEHLAAHAAAKSHGYSGESHGYAGESHGYAAAPAYGGYHGDSYGAGHYAGHYGYPALGHDGQPKETPEVVALKHAHFAAHAEAKARNYGHGGDDFHGDYHGDDYSQGGYVSGHHGAYHGPLHYPVIGHNGVPHDTAEVVHARKYHLAAHAEAAARAYEHGYDHGHHGY